VAPPPAEPAAAEPVSKRETERPTVAVLDLVDKGGGSELAVNMGQAIAAELGGLGPFEVVSSEDIRRMISVTIEKQMAGCEDATCLAEVGGALGARYIVSGTLAVLDDQLVLTLQLMDMSQNKVIAREMREMEKGSETLLDDGRTTARALVRVLLEQASGYLVVRLSEEGANIEINERLAAVSPSPRLEVPSGPHRVAITKEGFIRWARDVEVVPNETTVADAVLIPSPEFVEDYESSASFYRITAWTLTGIGVGATATGAALLMLQGDERARLSSDIEDFNRGESDATRQDLNRRIDRVDREYKIYQAVAFGGVAALGAALYFWLAGDPPGKYREFRSGDVSVGMAPASDAVLGWVGGSF
jgi:TolB-like protein